MKFFLAKEFVIFYKKVILGSFCIKKIEKKFVIGVGKPKKALIHKYEDI